MSHKNNSRTAELPGTIGEVVANTLLAFALAFFAVRLGLALGFEPHFIMMMDLAVFFFIIHADPIGMLRRRPTTRELAAKAAVGMVLGVFVMLMFPGAGTLPAGEATANGTVPGGGMTLARTILPLLLLTPILFFTPFLERWFRGRAAKQPVSMEEAKISAVFPVFITLHMALMLSVPGVMWVIGMPPAWALATAMLGVILAVFEAWYADDDDQIGDPEDSDWGPRPESAAEAWSGLKKGVRALFASSLFVGATIYLSILTTMPFLNRFEFLDAAPITAIGSVAVGGMLVLGVFLAVSVLAVLALAAAAYAVGRRSGADPLTALELARQASARLFGGGMHFVRPDLADD